MVRRGMTPGWNKARGAGVASDSFFAAGSVSFLRDCKGMTARKLLAISVAVSFFSGRPEYQGTLWLLPYQVFEGSLSEGGTLRFTCLNAKWGIGGHGIEKEGEGRGLFV